MKKILVIIIIALVGNFAYAQTGSVPTPLSTLYEWHVSNTGTSAGERIVAYINSGTIGNYRGGSISGQVIDVNGNWGFALPIVANFKLFTDFSDTKYGLTQDVAAPSVTLELKSISATQWALVANCLVNRQFDILFRVAGVATVTLGDPTTVNSTGTMLISAPTYQSNFTGNLFLNVTNPVGASGYTLAVGGSAVATSMTVKLQSSWPDYVFKPNYFLRQLADVKSYVAVNHHLPDMPSESQIAADGLNLGEMDKLLTKKVEELTLYLIDKDKQLNDEKQTNFKQQQEIDQLKQQVQQLVIAVTKSKNSD